MIAAALRRLAKSRFRRDERGSTLVLVLVLVIIIGVTGVAILNQEGSGFTAQTTLKAKGSTDVEAQSALDAVTQRMITNPTWGVTNGESKCPNQVPSDYALTGADNLGTYSIGNDLLTVKCQTATPHSGMGTGLGAAVLPNTILTLGGVSGRGAPFVQGATVLSAAKTAVGATWTITYTLQSWPGFVNGDLVSVFGITPDTWNVEGAAVSNVNSGAKTFQVAGVTTDPGTTASMTNTPTAEKLGSNEPFCQDWSLGGNGSCEAGVWFGPSTGFPTTSPLTVGQTDTGNNDVLVTNGSIIVNHNQVVEGKPASQDGDIYAKVSGNAIARYWCDNDKGPTAPNNYQLEAGWTPSATYNNNLFAGNTYCNDNARAMQDEPNLWHRLPDRADQPGESSGLPLRSVPSCPNVTNNYDKNFVEFLPGRYTDLNALNNLFQNCEALFWFNPGYKATDPSTWDPSLDPYRGVFYFDVGGALNGTLHGGSQIVGGTPQGWTPPKFNAGFTGSTGWACDLGVTTSCTLTAQTDKPLDPTTYAQSAWDSNPANAIGFNDGYWAKTIINRCNSCSNRDGSANSSITLQNISTPVPGDTTTTVSSVKILIQHQEPTADPTHVAYASGYPQLTLTVSSGNFSGNCVVPLGSSPAFWKATGGTDTIDITNGCYGVTVDGAWVQSTSGQAGDWRSAGCIATAQCMTRANWSAPTVSSLKFTYTGQVNDTYTVEYDLEGARVQASYTGRPAPQYPGACSATSNGVQLLFGGKSFLVWPGNATDRWAELCGSRFEQGGNIYDTYGSVIYGLSPGKAPPPATMTSGPVASGGGTNSVNTTTDGPRTDVLPANTNDGHNPTNPVGVNLFRYPSWTVVDPNNPPGGAAEMTSEGADVTKALQTRADDTACVAPADPTLQCGQVLTATWSGNTAQAWAELKVPSDFVPTGATITRVYLEATHREKQAAGTCTSNVQQTTPIYCTGIDQLDLKMTSPVTTATWSASSATNGPVDPSCTPHVANSWAATDDSCNVARLNGLDPGPEAQGQWQTFHWGDYVADANNLNDAWRWERSLTQAFSNPADVNGAIIRFTASGNDATSKTVQLDNIKLKVDYRPADSLKPLNDCLTTRYYSNPQHSNAHGVDGMWQTSLDGVDRRVPDWGARHITNTGVTTWQSDASYTPNASGYGNSDVLSCPLLQTDLGVHLHIVGTIFAPTAALDMRGSANGASMFTGGAVARTMTIYRWDQSGNYSFAGLSPPPKRSRDVILTVLDSNGTVVEREQVHLSATAPTADVYWKKRRQGAS